MPIALIVELIQALAALAPQIPEVIVLGESAVGILRTGVCTPAQESTIRAQLDAVKLAIDAA